MEKQEKQESKKPQTKNYFFPNYREGLPFRCEAETQDKAEEANKDYLKQQKDNK